MFSVFGKPETKWPTAEMELRGSSRAMQLCAIKADVSFGMQGKMTIFISVLDIWVTSFFLRKSHKNLPNGTENKKMWLMHLNCVW